MPLRFRSGLTLGICAAILAIGCGGKRPPAQRLPIELLKTNKARSREVARTGAVVGVVLAPDGTPVDAALVTAVGVDDDPEDGKPPFITVSADRGKFELKDMPPGNYGLTITAPPLPSKDPGGVETVLAGSYAGVVNVQAGETGPPILTRLSHGGTIFRGRVVNEKREGIANALVRGVRRSAFEGDHFFAKTAEDGRFVLGVPSGDYFLVAEHPGRQPVRVDLPNSSQVTSPKPQTKATKATKGDVAKTPPTDLEIQLNVALVNPPESDLSGWMTESGGVLSSPDIEDTRDLTKLRALVGDARVVGFGEASYTAGEIARLKFSMFKYLVEQASFSTLIIEATQADVRPLDDYILHGTGNLKKIVSDLGYFSLDTEETLALFTWMRAYNEDRAHKTKLRVFGMDVQRTAAAATFLESYLSKVDKAFAQTVETTLTRMRTNELGAALRARPADEQADFASDVEKLAAKLAKNRRVYLAKSHWIETTRAEQDAAALVWAVRVARSEQQRPLAMADTVKRTLAELPPSTKTVIFGHISQMTKRAADGGMGTLLSDSLKKDYTALAFTFYQGWIRAWDFTQGPTVEHGTKLFRLPPSEAGTFEALLDRGGAPIFFADVRKAPPSVLPWLQTRIAVRSVGATFESDRRARLRTVVSDAFDGVVFVKKLTTVRFTETGKRPPQKESE
ncbi:MAG: erythromycin esterase family protein [Polyangiaceae bacterium]|nr:erythromycin esterase family protein [Polyangiaceae bacterium]